MDGQRISWFNERNAEGSLNLNPKYQRKPVWSMKNKQYLIDTILKGLPIPEIFMQIKTDSEGTSEYIIIDGQQRVRAILEFIAGEFEVNEEDNQEFSGKTFQKLPTGTQQEFWGYAVHVREIKSNYDEEIRAIFQRMNKNVVQLNPQEIRNATYIGHLINLVNELADEQEFYSENSIFTANDIKRMKDAEFISELFISMMYGIQNKKDNLDEYYRIHDSVWDNKEEMKKEYNRIIILLGDIFESLKGTRWKTKSDFQSLFYTLYELNREYIIPAEKYEEIKDCLINFSDRVVSEGVDSADVDIKEYSKTTIAHTNDKSQKEIRNKILRNLLVGFLIPRDKKRNFTEEERMIIWAKSDKKCCDCKNTITYEQYHADHTDAHSKGGKTILDNGRVLCIGCNLKKSNK